MCAKLFAEGSDGDPIGSPDGLTDKGPQAGGRGYAWRMPHLHGWTNDLEDTSFWAFGGRHVIGAMWGPELESGDWSVRVWPRLGDIDSPDPTKPLGAEHGSLTFKSETEARAYLESFDRAKD